MPTTSATSAGAGRSRGRAEAERSRRGPRSCRASAAVLETPYAEGVGDRSDLSLAAEDVAAVRAVRSAGVPTVVVLVSGRPLILGPVLADADVIVAAWLPGTEGAGVGDVLFGDFAPTGTLSHSWPRTMAQVPINWGDAAYDPLFAYGYGLTY